MAGILIVSCVGAVTGIASAISGGLAERNKNQAVLNATQLDQRSNYELNKAMAQAKDKTDRLKI
jgi:hypothetical protein